jgi:hypothetical protein
MVHSVGIELMKDAPFHWSAEETRRSFALIISFLADEFRER